MFVRDNNGKLVRVKIKDFDTSEEFYKYLWLVKYNKKMSTRKSNIKNIFDYTKGTKKFI
mgnify:CR=1 FL=1